MGEGGDGHRRQTKPFQTTSFSIPLWVSQLNKLILVELVFTVLPVPVPSTIMISRWNGYNFAQFGLQKLCPSTWKPKRWFVKIDCPPSTLFWRVLPGRCFCCINKRPLTTPAKDLEPLFRHYAKNPQLYFIWFWQGDVCIFHFWLSKWEIWLEMSWLKFIADWTNLPRVGKLWKLGEILCSHLSFYRVLYKGKLGTWETEYDYHWTSLD